MIPLDALKKVEGGVELKMINMVTTIPIGEAPGDPVDLLEIKVNDVQLTREQMLGITIEWEDNKYTMENLRDAGTIPVNVELKFTVPYPDVEVGQNAKIEISVPQFSVAFDFERIVGE
jgi:hypothetical protein